MKIGDLVRLWIDAETYEDGIVVQIDDQTLPEKIFVRTLDARIVEGYDDECEVFSAAG